MEKHIRLSCLIDCYGPLLTERQLNLISLSVNEDLSLGEIAEQEGISRQGVRDAIKRAEEQLEEYESRLGLMQRRQLMTRGLQEIRDGALDMDTERLKGIAERLLEICEDGI